MFEFELYLSDLTKEAQERLLKFWDMKDLSDGNFGVFPIHVFCKDEDEEK